MENFDPSSTTPFLSVILNATVGFWPALAFVTLTIWTFGFRSWSEYSGIVWPPLMEASNSSPLSGTWQELHAASLVYGPAG